jgi:hypothetical protein
LLLRVEVIVMMARRVTYAVEILGKETGRIARESARAEGYPLSGGEAFSGGLESGS